LLELGVGSGVVRYVSYYNGLGDRKNVNEVMSTAMVLYLFVGLIIFLVSLFAARPIANFFKSDEQLVWLIRILGFASVIACPTNVLDACVRAHERWIPANMFSISTAVLRSAGLMLSVWLGYGLIGMGVVVLCVNAISLVIVSFVFRKCCSSVALRPSSVKAGCIKTLISFGILINIGALIFVWRLPGHNIIIGKLISIGAVGLYAVAITLIKNANLVAVTPIRVFWPRFAFLHGEGRHEDVKQLMIKTTRFCAALAAGLMLMVFTLGPAFIRLWVPGDFSAIYPSLMILGLGYLLETSLGTSVPFLGSTGHQKVQAIIAAAEGIVEFGLSIYLGIKIGLIGVPLGFVIGSFTVNGLVCSWYVCRLLEISIIRYFLRCLSRPWLILAVIGIGAFYMGVRNFADTWIKFVFASCFIMSLYAVCTYIFTLDSGERGKINGLIKRYLVWSRGLLGGVVEH
jgi:O-antigen/teichoic acid export membrane protein